MFTFEWALILPVMMRMLHHQGFQLLLGMPPPNQPTNTPIRCNKTWRHHLTERVVRNSHDAFTDTVRFPPDPPAAPQSAQVPLPGFSTSLFTRCLFTTWSEVIVAVVSALILFLSGRNPPTPARGADATFAKCSVTAEWPESEAWCSPHAAVKRPLAALACVCLQWHPQRSLRCRKCAKIHPFTPPFLLAPVSTSV